MLCVTHIRLHNPVAAFLHLDDVKLGMRPWTLTRTQVRDVVVTFGATQAYYYNCSIPTLQRPAIKQSLSKTFIGPR